MDSLYKTGIREDLDKYLIEKSKERRNYGELWSASSAGYCMRKNIFDRLQVPFINDNPRKQRVFESGHIFHQWAQGLTKEMGLSIAQEVELIDEELKVKGHFDDLVLKDGKLILYDIKTAHSRSFTFSQGRPMSWYHRHQLGSYVYMLKKLAKEELERRHGRK